MKSIFLYILWLAACTDTQPSQKEAISTVPPPDLSSCFEKYIDKLDELLTRADILSIYTAGMQDAEMKYPRIGPASYHVCTYEWKSERTSTYKVGSYETTIPTPNRIGIGALSTYGEKIKDPLVYFKNAHRTPTAEEKAKMYEMMEEEMKERGSTDAEAKSGTRLTGTIADKVKFTPVEGLGDAAAWDYMDSALAVLVGRTKFKVIVNISDDARENQALAEKLARLVLKKC